MMPSPGSTWVATSSRSAAIEEAAAAFDQARQIGLPWRMLWYQFGPFEAYYETGRYDEVIALADATLQTRQPRRGAVLLAGPGASRPKATWPPPQASLAAGVRAQRQLRRAASAALDERWRP